MLTVYAQTVFFCGCLPSVFALFVLFLYNVLNGINTFRRNIKMADQIDEHLRYQDYLIMRLTRLNSIVESLLAEEDTLRHQHTLNYYLKELDKVKREAVEFNNVVQQIINRVYELKEKRDDKTVQN